MATFVGKGKRDQNFIYWWNYLNMVSRLLSFIRAQQQGLWGLHLETFCEMLPYFHRYDHINYARWGCVHLAQMNQLPLEVEQEFRNVNFVVKASDKRFNQVDPDHALEWLNAVGKKSGGIVGITKTNKALARWTLSYNLRANVASQTYKMMKIDMDTLYTLNESTTACIIRDNRDEDSILKILLQFKVFNEEAIDRPNKLLNIVTRDVSSTEIEDSLLNAERLGQNQLETFVTERLVEKTVSIKDPLPKAKAHTFASLYDVCTKTPSGKIESLKADRNFLQRRIAAYRARRPVDLCNILNHELMKVPLSIADTSGALRSGTKSILFDVFTQGVSCPQEIVVEQPATLIIDGQAAIMSLGKPSNANTFGEYANEFIRYIFRLGHGYSRIDISFDRYWDISIKGHTRAKRTIKS